MKRSRNHEKVTHRNSSDASYDFLYNEKLIPYYNYHVQYAECVVDVENGVLLYWPYIYLILKKIIDDVSLYKIFDKYKHIPNDLSTVSCVTERNHL